MKNLVTARAVRCLFMLLAGALCVFSAAAAAPSLEPTYNPKLQVRRAPSSVEIDGLLDDQAWLSAGRAHQFLERNPGDKIAPLVRTEAYVTYDDDKLYVAFFCHDNPDDIRATMCQRDQFHGDDAVGLMLDTYGDASWAYEFYVNPYGVQKDMLWTNIAGEDSGYDLIWEAAAKITDSGYQVEMAIPFSSMRFPTTDVQNWKIDFWRIHPRESYHQYSWAPRDRDEQCWVCQWGTVEGIENVQPGRGLEILPTYIANQSGVRVQHADGSSSFDNDDVLGEPSLGAKYSISSNVTAEGSYNPDFSQIEADASQIDVNTTFALFFPERRPFFQEGADLFRTLFNSFYTRTINDPQFAAKITGRTDGASFGFLTAFDENTPYIIPMDQSSQNLLLGKSTTNALRGVKTFGNNHQIGFIATDRRFEGGGSGSILAFDHDIRLSRNFSFDGQYVYSHTAEPDDSTAMPGWLAGETFGENDEMTYGFDGESFSGTAFISRLRRNGRNWNSMLTYSQVDRGYRTQTGFDPVVNYRYGQFWNGYNIYFDEGIVERITPQIYTEGRWDYDGIRQNALANFAVDFNLRLAQSYVSLFHSRSAESYDRAPYNGLWSTGLQLGTRPNRMVSINLNADYGRRVAYFSQTTAKTLNAGASMTLKPFDRLVIEPNINFARSKDDDGTELYSGFVTRTRFRVQATREMSVRLVLQYNDFREAVDVDPLLTYRLSPFSVFYVGSTLDYQQSHRTTRDEPMGWHHQQRQVFMKLQYLFQT